MAFDTGIFIDLDDPNTIADPAVIAAASAIQLPFNLGRFWEDMGVIEEPTSNPKFEIYTRSETPRSGTIGTGGWTDGTTTTALPVTDASGLIRGLILKIEDEVVVIKSVNVGGNTIDVWERGTAGTTGATHIATTPYSVQGSAVNDQDLDDIDSVHEVTNIYENYVQTLAEPIDYTKGGILNPRKGVSDSIIATMREEAMLRVAKNIYATSINGLKSDKTNGSTKRWMTAGLLQQLSDNSNGRVVSTYNVGGALTEAAFKAALRVVFERGMPTDIYVSSANKDIINEFLGASAATRLSVNTDMGNTTAGYYIDSYNYEGNILNVKIDNNMPNDKIAIVNINKCKKGWKAGDALVLYDVETSNPRTMKAIYSGSFTIAIEDVGYEHILLTGITTS